MGSSRSPLCYLGLLTVKTTYSKQIDTNNTTHNTLISHLISAERLISPVEEGKYSAGNRTNRNVVGFLHLKEGLAYGRT